MTTELTIGRKPWRRWACIIALGAAILPAMADDLLPLEHSLRYVGRDGRIPVVVEITLRERVAGELEYVQWVTPAQWGAWFREPAATRCRLRYRDGTLATIDVDDGLGAKRPPSDLSAGALDALAVRLRARADIARGLKQAEYTVWTGGDGLEQWTLEVSGPDSVDTPDGRYEALRFRLGSDSEWIEGWSAPLLVFHFVRIEHWRDGKKVGELSLDDKQL